RDGFGTLYRYVGATGRVEPVISSTGWTFARQTASGLYAIGLQGGVVFVPWSGAPQIVTCGGVALAISATGACASRRYGPDGGLYVQHPGAAPLRILPPDWGAGQIAWDPSSRRLALTRTVDQRCMRCPNALYVITPDGSPRLLYDTHVDETHFGPLGAVARVLWSPAGVACGGGGGGGSAGVGPRGWQRSSRGSGRRRSATDALRGRRRRGYPLQRRWRGASAALSATRVGSRSLLDPLRGQRPGHGRSRAGRRHARLRYWSRLLRSRGMVPGTWPRVARYLRVRMRLRIYQSGEIDYEIATDQ